MKNDVCLTKLENDQILLNKISHRCLVAPKLFSGWKSLINSNVSKMIYGWITDQIK